MKNNEMESCGLVLTKLPQKIVDDHPYVVLCVALSPIIVPLAEKVVPVIWRDICKGAKYLVDKATDCYCTKVMAENGLIVTKVRDDFETSRDDSVDV